MTVEIALDLLQKGGALAASVIIIWALITGRVVPRWMYDKLDARMQKAEAENERAAEELRKTSSTNARMVETIFSQQTEAATIRRGVRTRQEAIDEADIGQQEQSRR